MATENGNGEAQHAAVSEYYGKVLSTSGKKCCC
jgi:hypothetical protein